ncbi:hypothetical protein CEE69_14640 [Rhodopirellula bahusiensis]|uniref:Uncharacterized protein n=1 Tax=Rhodopirellula bahusiensis TaxID=2014065 RepID=A0A2G1W7M2_9BACT|nr:hypothetical protein CEE69_14640 [Rhodopirellula bahusiensis]
MRSRATEANVRIVRSKCLSPVTPFKAAVPKESGEHRMFGFATRAVDNCFMAPMKSASRR